MARFVRFQNYGPNAVEDYATSSNLESLVTWSFLGALLTNYTARAIYALPILPIRLEQVGLR